MKNSFEISQKDTQEVSSKTNEISLYNDKIASPDVTAQGLVKLKIAFPKMDKVFFNILTERIVANRFTENRLSDAVNNILDNFKYKELVVSDIIQFDKRVKLYTYNEVCNMVTKNQASFSDFEVREINGHHFRIRKSDII